MPNEDALKTEIIVDVRALRTEPGGARSRTFDNGTAVFLSYRPEVAGTLKTAVDAKDALIERARAEHGWGVTAAIEATKVYAERYKEALNLSRVVQTYCGGSYSAEIRNPYEWSVALKSSADPSEFISLIRAYQATLLPE